MEKKIMMTNPAPPHGALGERNEQNKEATMTLSSISGTTVIPSRKLKEHIAVPKVQHPDKTHKKTEAN